MLFLIKKNKIDFMYSNLMVTKFFKIILDMWNDLVTDVHV